MPGFLPDEGESLLVDIMAKRDLTDRAVGLELGLFVNVAPGETIAHSGITEPAGTGYSRKSLTDGSWTGSGSARSYAMQEWTAGADWTGGNVQGYFICTTGATKRLIAVEAFTVSYDINNGDKLQVTPTLTGI